MFLNVIESYIVHAKRILRDQWTRTHLNATVQWTVAKSVSRRMHLSVIESYIVHCEPTSEDQGSAVWRVKKAQESSE